MFPLQGGTPPKATLYADDVFTAYTRTGTGASATVTTGIDLAAKGGLIWTKGRSGATNHKLTDTARGVTKALTSNTTSGQVTDATGITAISATGHTVGADATYNTNGATYVDWVFAKAPKFFDVVTYTGDGVAGRQIPHALGVAPGMVIVKSVSTVNNWIVYHRSIAATNYLYLNATSVSDVFSGFWNDAEPTSSVFTVGNNASVNAAGVTYVAYLFAHDTSADGIVQCGSFTTNGSGNATVNLGWEPQFLTVKNTTGVSDNWYTFDSSRGWNMSGSDASLNPNLSASENTPNIGNPTATGFTASSFTASTIYIYLAIRRPNKPPTLGTQVYKAIARTGTGAAATVTGVGFAPDLVGPTRTAPGAKYWFDRLRGKAALMVSTDTASETSITQSLTSFDMDGFSVGNSTTINAIDSPYINWCFKRAPGVFDVVCYTGTGVAKTEAHGLGVAPELWIVKGRSGVSDWRAGSTALAATEVLVLNSTAAKATDATSWNSTYPTATVFSLGTQVNVNTSAATYVAYLFATKAGISKVFSYTGNGSSQTINCGFTTGARWVMVKRTDATGDWFVWDSTRGIVAGNDPHLSLNTTAAEVTTDDSVDTDTTGFIVNQLAATNVNVTSATYIGLAFA